MGILSAEEGHRFGLLAVERGFISRKQLEEACIEQTAPGDSDEFVCRTLDSILVERGWLTPQDVSSLRRQFAREGKGEGPEAPAEVRETLEDPARAMADFVLVKLLGQGAGGEVWKAWDRTLGRWVAIKRAPAASAASIIRDRFYREAQAAARLKHPHILPIFSVGEHEGRPYIAMQLVEGRALEGTKLPVRRAMEIIHTVAQAIEHAHENGVVHRDLKPGNVMVDSRNHAWVLDFGLARFQDGSLQVTAEGAVLGTPSYMAPEQARGDIASIGPATDIYALGSTLYGLLTARLPFPGESLAEVVQHVIDREPKPLREVDPEIPGDVETIVRKAMEKEPLRRYRSAAGFAEDVRRWMEGEPIVARAPSLLYAWRKKLARHRPVAIAAGLGLIGLLLLALLVPRWLKERSAHAEALQRMKSLAELTVSQFELEQTRPPHDMTTSREQMLQVEEELGRLLRDDPKAHEVRILLGRLRKCRGAWREARDSLDEGLSKLGERAKGADYLERAIVELALWQEDMDSVALLPQERREERIQRARSHLESARRDSEEAVRRGLSEVKPGRDRLVAAAIEFAQGRYDSCRRLCGEIARVGNDPVTLGEAWKLSAQTWLQESKYREAIEDYEKAYAEKRSDRDAYVSCALARALWIEGELHPRGDDFRKLAEEGRREAENAKLIDPSSAPAWYAKSHLALDVGEYLSEIGEAPEGEFDNAIEGFTEVIGRDRGCAEAWASRGSARLYRAQFGGAHGSDPKRHLGFALRDYEHALILEPRFSKAFAGRGRVYLVLARQARKEGKDPSEPLKNAFSDFDMALAERRDLPDALMYRGGARVVRALQDEANGGDPTAEFTRAIEDYTGALKARAHHSETHNLRGLALMYRARYRLWHGGDLEKDLDDAIGDFGEAIRINPRNADSLTNQALAYVYRGRWRLGRGGDPTSDLDHAIACCDQADKLNLKNADGFYHRGLAHLWKARHLREKSEDPTPELDPAIQAFSKAQEIDARSSDAFHCRGLAYIERARADPSRKEDLRKAVEDCTEALRLDPSHAEARANRGRAWLLLEDWPRAVEDMNAAIRANPALEADFKPMLDKARRNLKP